MVRTALCACFLFFERRRSHNNNLLVPMKTTVRTSIMVLEAKGLSKSGGFRVATEDVLSGKGREAFWFEDTLRSMLSCVHAHGGDLVSMDDDVLVFAWTGDDAVADLTTTAHQAVASLKDIYAKFGSKAKGAKATSSLRGGVSAGDVEIIFAGDVDRERCFFLLSGETYTDAMNCMKEANGEEVVISASLKNKTLSIFGNPLRLTKSKNASIDLRKASIKPMFKLDSQYDVLKLAKSNDDFDNLEGELMYFVPPPILQILSHEGRDEERWANDRRMETSIVRLRVKIGDSKALDTLQNCISTVQDVIHQYGGDVLNLYMNERSDLCVLACFGMPTELHEDDPERAVLASMKIRAELSTCPTLAVVTSGAVFCGSVGLDNSKRYTVLGVPVCRSSEMLSTCTKSSGICCDSETHEACTENGELFFRPCAAGTTCCKSCFTPYPDSKNESNKAWHAACLSGFRMQLKHRRDAWSKHTHTKASVNESAANTKILLSATKSSTMVEILNNWSKSNQKGADMYSLEGALGHGKSEILKHAIASVIQKNQNILYGFIDADPLTTSAENQNMVSIASVLHDVFSRGGRKTADQIETHCISILKASGENFVALAEWLSALNPIFPVNFGFRSDNARKLVMSADKDDNSRELLEVTQRTVLVGLIWALSNTRPLLIAIDDALDMDAKSFVILEDLLNSGSSILSQYNIINPAILDFLVKECVPGKMQSRKVCVILSMHPFEDCQEHMPPSVSVMLRDCFSIGKDDDDSDGTDAKSRCQRLFVPLLNIDSTEELFIRCMKKMFPKLKRLDAQGRQSVFKQSEGNPLFIREIADELMDVYKTDAKKIVLDKTETVLTYNLKASDLGLPPNLEMKLGIEIDHQHLAAQLILKLIAVAGRSMTLKEIYHSFPMEHHLDQIPAEIEHLLEEELVYDVNEVRLKSRKQSLSKGLDSPLLSMKFYFTTEFLHHAIERRLLLEQAQKLKERVDKMSNMKDLSVPDHIFDDHSVSTEWGLGWGAEELWRLQTAKRERKLSEERKET